MSRRPAVVAPGAAAATSRAPAAVHTYLIGYPNKVAVIWVFDRVVVCGACSAPSNASLPRGRVIRLSFDLRTHAVRAADGIRFCESRGSYPPRAACLRR